jgi:large subunit ribosomal protein L4
LFKGGGRVFGPRPKDYGFKLNKKVKRLARMSALTYKANTESITILEGLKMDSPKTKDFIALLENYKITSERTLFVLGAHDANVYMSSRNIPRTQVVTADTMNTYDILKAKKLFIAEDALEVINNILK